MEYVHWACWDAFCVTLTSIPAMVAVPLLEEVVVFGETRIDTVAVPFPLEGLTENQFESEDVVQGQLFLLAAILTVKPGSGLLPGPSPAPPPEP
jgi:hypothetical protein